MRRHLLPEYIDLVDQLVYRLATLLADTFVVLEDILRAYVKRAQIIEEESLEFLPSVVMVDLHQVLFVLGIIRGVLKVFFYQHNLGFYTPVDYRPPLIHVFICPGELLQLKIGLTFIDRDFGPIQLCLLLPTINISEVDGLINSQSTCHYCGRVSLAVTCLCMRTSHGIGERKAAITI